MINSHVAVLYELRSHKRPFGTETTSQQVYSPGVDCTRRASGLVQLSTAHPLAIDVIAWLQAAGRLISPDFSTFPNHNELVLSLYLTSAASKLFYLWLQPGQSLYRSLKFTLNPLSIYVLTYQAHWNRFQQ
jgi:hypothetical protein